MNVGSLRLALLRESLSSIIREVLSGGLVCGFVGSLTL